MTPHQERRISEGKKLEAIYASIAGSPNSQPVAPTTPTNIISSRLPVDSPPGAAPYSSGALANLPSAPIVKPPTTASSLFARAKGSVGNIFATRPAVAAAPITADRPAFLAKQLDDLERRSFTPAAAVRPVMAANILNPSLNAGERRQQLAMIGATR